MLIHENIVTEVTRLLHTEKERLTPHLDEVEGFAIEYLESNLFRKLKGNSKHANTAAFRTWEECEAKCYQTNNHLNSVNWAYHPLIKRAARICKSILGNPDFIGDFGTLSNNATYDHKFGTHKSFKVKCAATITTSALLWCHSSTNPWFSSEMKPVRGNRMSFVPKTAETSRPIAVEPTFNVAYQQAIGQIVRTKLKKVGIDLNNQNHNKNAAQNAMRCGLATIDLKSASDTLAFEAVRAVLPPEWFQIMAELRSPMTRLPNGKWRHLEKFSSMGNGFNFELETLIFFCICRACGVKKPLVYGDDIIVPQKEAPLVIKALEFMGFIVNKYKTFLSGNFFESCGGHYLYGLDVTPAYQKESLTHEAEVIRFHNRLYRWALRDPYSTYENKRFKYIASTLRYLRSLCDKTYIPDTLQRDDGFLRPLSFFKTKVKHGVVTYLCCILVQKTQKCKISNDGAYLYKLLHPSELNASKQGYPVYLRDCNRSPTPLVKEVELGAL